MKLLLFDGNSVINRAFYGIRALSTREGVPTNAVVGFINIYQKMVTREQPELICVAFDRREPTFRHKRYEGYKAQRKGMPDELAAQMPLVKEWLDKMGIPYRLFEPTGLVGEIKGGKPGKCIALRADIDALTTTEKTGLPYASENEGYMHACGHDTHTAMLLGAAKILSLSLIHILKET